MNEFSSIDPKTPRSLKHNLLARASRIGEDSSFENRNQIRNRIRAYSVEAGDVYLQ